MSNSTPTLFPPERWIERRAKLFEAGDYPDKGVTVTSAHLQALANTFAEPVPILIEHAKSPLEIGFLSAVFCEGDELFGSVSLSPEADALVERSSAKSLSLGLAADLSAIREVSLVRNPRIPSARLFNSEVNFHGVIAPSALAEEWERLRKAQVQQDLADFMRCGKMTPAQARFAEPLLMSDDTIEFDGASTPVRQLVSDFIEAQPKLALFGELTPAPASSPTQGLRPEEVDFYRQHFPEISLSEIAKRRN